MTLWQILRESRFLRAVFDPPPERVAAEQLYKQIVEQSRRPEFYVEGGVVDSVDGRFDLIALHVFFVLHRLKEANAGASPIAQRLFDVFFQNMDEGLREMGVGDLSVGSKIRKMAEAFYGRVAAYEDGLKSDQPEHLAEALRRNLYRASDVSHSTLSLMEKYVRRQTINLSRQKLDSLAAGGVTFEPLHG